MTDDAKDNAAIVATWRDWIVNRMMQEVIARRDPGSIDDVKAAADQAKSYFEERMDELSKVLNA